MTVSTDFHAPPKEARLFLNVRNIILSPIDVVSRKLGIIARHVASIDDENATCAPAPTEREQPMRQSNADHLNQRLMSELTRLRQEAARLPLGAEREIVLRRARQLRTALEMNAWLCSPGLQAPT